MTIDNWNTYYFVRTLLELNLDFIVKNNNVIVLFKDGIKFSAPLDKLSLLIEAIMTYLNFKKEYDLSEEEIENKTVLDAGAFLGESSIWFCKNGARKVISIEPVFYELVKENIELNNMKDRIKIYPNAITSSDFTEINISIEGMATGSNVGNLKIGVITWESILENWEIDIAKVDIEGWEYTLLSVPDKLLQRIPIWIIEIHGFPGVLINKFTKAGFKYKFITRHSFPNSVLYVYKFFR